MKKVIALVLACLLCVSVFAEDVNRTIGASRDGQVKVSNISGSVTVSGWSRNEVEVTGRLGRNVEELILERDGDHVLIKVKVPNRSRGGIESDLDIKVPQNSSVDIGTVSADISIAGVKGDQSLHTVSGDIDTVHSGAEIDAESVSGDVDIRGDGSDGEVDATTVSGDVNLHRVSGDVSAESVSGDLYIEDGSFHRVDLETVNGDIEFTAELRKNGRLKAESVNGAIEIQFVGDVSAEFDIETFNGKINNCFGPKAERTSKYAPGWELEFEEGGGSAKVDVATLNGRVTICR